MSDARFFECAFTHDQDQDGNLPPATVVAVTVARPTLAPGGGVDLAPESARVQAIKGTRIFETSDPVIAEALAQCPDLRETDKPSAKTLKDQRDSSAAYEAAQKANNTITEA